MRTGSLLIALVAVVGLAASVGCVQSPTGPGILYMDVKGPLGPAGGTKTPRKGEACARVALALFAWGDASLETAKRKGRITDAQMRRLQDEAASLYESDLFVDDSAGLTATALRAKCRRLKARHNIQMVVIDYLQLLTVGGRVESRQQEISTISRGLKSLARELNVPVIALSQLNRDVESRDDHRPRMSDLRESGAIEQDADVIILLHREDYYKPTEENAGLAQVIVAKQRNGPTGDVTLRFFREYMRFENYTRRAEPMQ